MNRNYYLFEKQVEFLHNKLQSYQLTDCFTHRKEELVLRLASGEENLLRIGLNSQYPYILLYPYHETKDPKARFFEKLYEQKISSFRIIPFDKIVYIDFEIYTIRIVFFGKSLNIFLTDNHNKVIETFKKGKNAESEHKTMPDQNYNSNIPVSVSNKVRAGTSISTYLHAKFAGFNKLMITELCYRGDLDPQEDISKFDSKQWELFTNKSDLFIEELKKGKVYLYEPIQKPSIISLLQLQHIPDSIPVMVNNDVNELWIKFIYQNQFNLTLRKILNESKIKISKRIDYLKITLQKITDIKELEKKKIISELKGNLLLTFSSQIQRGLDQVQLKNIYSDHGEEMVIKLDPKLNAQQNANKYFQKYKNIDEKKLLLKTKKETVLDELEYWKKSYDSIEKIDNLKKAEKLKQSLIQNNLTQNAKSKKKNASLNSFSFNRLLLDQQWEVLVGKNAQNNDLLTFKFANKYDLWFHAQSVPGSHVIIRSRERGQFPPMNIIEQVASIAAYFSAAKNSSTVAVNYTEVRYVRKPRKSKPGTALLTQSKTIFVQPKKYL